MSMSAKDEQVWSSYGNESIGLNTARADAEAFMVSVTDVKSSQIKKKYQIEKWNKTIGILYMEL